MNTSESTFINISVLKRILVLAVSLFGVIICAFSQNNVPNHSFDIIESCDLSWGDVSKAKPWMNGDNASADLFHFCATGQFYTLPFIYDSTEYRPYKGTGMVGMSLYGESFARESISASFTELLPANKTLYCAMSVRSESPSFFFGKASRCESNGIGMKTILLKGTTRTILEAKNVIRHQGGWTKLEACYQTKGDERKVLIENPYSQQNTKFGCDSFTASVNSYMYIDEIVVEEFDVLPDEIILCGDSTMTYNISFHDKELLWSDGYLGSKRTFDKSGKYRAFIVVGDCVLEDEVDVYILAKDEPFTLDTIICRTSDAKISLPFQGNIAWDNGSLSNNLAVVASGRYGGKVNSVCGIVDFNINVNMVECGIKVNAPNIFSPNGDGREDVATFYWESTFGFDGVFSVYDRWGNKVFSKSLIKDEGSITWNGLNNGNIVLEGVYVWQIIDLVNDKRAQGTITVVR